MIEHGRFYRAGFMKEIDPGHPNSTVPGDRELAGASFITTVQVIKSFGTGSREICCQGIRD